jgi:predicted transcriptional regulator
MKDLQDVRAVLDEINTAIAGYDPVLKEKARDILLQAAFGRNLSALTPNAGEETDDGTGRTPDGVPAKSSTRPDQSFANLLRRWHPERASEKALLGAYFLARVENISPITSQAINSVLKQNELSVSNITRAIETNLHATPPLIEQVRKLGTTRQARKEYRLTPEGARLVEQRLRGTPAS